MPACPDPPIIKEPNWPGLTLQLLNLLRFSAELYLSFMVTKLEVSGCCADENPLGRSACGATIYLAPTEVRYAKILTDKVSPLPTVNLAEAAALACRGLLLMIAVRQMHYQRRVLGTPRQGPV